MRKAAAFVETNARLIKKKLLWGSVRYGKNITEHEFFLARITGLSLYTFGIMAMLAMIESHRKQGLNIKEELLLLEYFVAEAEENRRHETSPVRGKMEKLHQRIFHALDSSDKSKDTATKKRKDDNNE